MCYPRFAPTNQDVGGNCRSPFLGKQTLTLMHVPGPGDLLFLPRGLEWRGVVMMCVESEYWPATCHPVTLVHDFIVP